jgi:(4S)-4-hydroxy-5-phosphonooxypentane-2,3-dione isomerase
MNVFAAIVDVSVMPEVVSEFETATEAHVLATRGESGNLAFYLLKSPTEIGKYLFFEVFIDRAAYDDHHHTVHYLRWRALVEPYMQRERTRTFWTVLEPEIVTKLAS